MRRADRLRMEALARDNARLRACLREIVVRCRGMGPGLASQALHSDRWPDMFAGEKSDDK